MLALLALNAAPPAFAADTPLDHGLAETVAVRVGDDVLLFGGLTGPQLAPTDAIVRFSLTNHSLTNDAARLPTPRSGVAAVVIDASRVALVGGTDGTKTFSDVSIFDAANDSLTTLTSLPHGVTGAAVVMVQGDLVVMGGRLTCSNGACTDLSDEVFSINLDARNVSAWQAHLPTGLAGAAPFATAKAIYLVGGSAETGGSIGATPAILALDPVNRSVTKVGDLPLALEPGRAWVVLTDRSVATFGGDTGGRPTAAIYRVEFEPLAVSKMDASLPGPRAGAAVVATPDGIWLFGGITQRGDNAAPILHYTPSGDGLALAAFTPASPPTSTPGPSEKKADALGAALALGCLALLALALRPRRRGP